MIISFLLQESGQLFTVDVSKDMEVENLKALIQMESQILPDQQMLTHNQNSLEDGMNLSNYSISDNDIIHVATKQATVKPSSVLLEEEKLKARAEQFRLAISSDYQLRERLSHVKFE